MSSCVVYVNYVLCPDYHLYIHCMCTRSIKAMFMLIDCKNRMATKSTLASVVRSKMANGVSAPLNLVSTLMT